MHREIKLSFFTLQLIVMYMYASANEPVYGCSQLHSLEHLLEKLVRIEFKLEQLEKKHGNAEESNGEESGSCVQLRRLDDLSQKMDLLEKSLKEQSQANVKVAFTAVLMGTSHAVNKYENVVFDKVQTNIGDAYKPSSGIFVAPLNGTYYFHTSFLSIQSSELWVGIQLNGADTARADARGSDGRHGTGSQSVILELKTGDIVSVKMLEVTSSSRWFRDRSFDNKTYLLGCGLVTRSQIHCADACAADTTYKSFFFAKGQLENCRILSIVLVLQSPNIVDLEGSAYFIMDKYPGLLFRGTVGIGAQFQMAAAWIAAGPGTTTNTSCRNVKLNGCSKHYRHALIDDWTTLNPQQLRYSIYKNEIEVAWVLFNETGSNMINWFHQSRVLSSSYTDLTPIATYNAFELNYSYSNISRHFYVSKDWGGCSNDNQWFCTYDNVGTCSHDNYANWPYIYYSKLGQVANTGSMGNFDFGDCSIVTVVS